MQGVFAFLRRWQIDGCQLVCKSWFIIIEESVDVLPLHPLLHWRLSAFYGCRFNCRAHNPCSSAPAVVNCVHTRTAMLRLRHERRTIQLLTEYDGHNAESPSSPTRQMGKSRRVDSLLRWPELFYHARNAYVEDVSLCHRTSQLGLFEAMQRFLGKVQAGTLSLSCLPNSLPDVRRFMASSFECVHFKETYFDADRSGCPDAIRRGMADFGRAEELKSVTTLHVTGMIVYGGPKKGFERLLDFLTALPSTMATVVLDLQTHALYFLDALLERNQAVCVQNVILQSLSTPYEDDAEILILKLRSVYAELFVPKDKGVCHTLHFDVGGQTIAVEIEVEQILQQGSGRRRFVEKVRLSHVERPATRSSCRGRSNLKALPPEVGSDALCFLQRKDVDACQRLSKQWRSMVEDLAGALPRHFVCSIEWDAWDFKRYPNPHDPSVDLRMRLQNVDGADEATTHLKFRLLHSASDDATLCIVLSLLRNAYVEFLTLPTDERLIRPWLEVLGAGHGPFANFASMQTNPSWNTVNRLRWRHVVTNLACRKMACDRVTVTELLLGRCSFSRQQPAIECTFMDGPFLQNVIQACSF